MSCSITCAIYESQDGEITCLKEGMPLHKGRKLLRERFQLMNAEEPNPFMVDDADVDLANPEARAPKVISARALIQSITVPPKLPVSGGIRTLLYY